MESSYLFEDRQDFLVMRITGTYRYWEFIQYPTLLRKECEALSCYKVLVDMLQVRYSEPTSLEQFILGEKIYKDLKDCIKIAFLVDRKSYIICTSKTAEIASLACFDTALRAKQWLRDDLRTPFRKTRKKGDFQR